ncbi:hypothetical protein [Thermomonospora umbrina]|uniref:hypothetical protein n=1 Tax=Thermomonospora umbrina TaxID=111806 RepID=UPI000E237F6F|nr:hypothetical protein [Thermomonospora umbrina]
MVALLTVRRGADIVGQCDATCYQAVGEVCRCVCEGENHGVGYDRAVLNTRAMAAGWVRRAQVADRTIDSYLLGDVGQLPLFDLGPLSG